MDHVDTILSQWARERPDLDHSPLAVIGRVSKASAAINSRLRVTFAQYGLGDGEFDVLATLRRSGSPFRLTPSQLGEQTMVTSGAVTKRVDRLERAGLVTRTASDGDGRVREVALTEAGRACIDEALTDHLATEERILTPLNREDRALLARLLRDLLGGLEANPEGNQPARP